MGRRLHEQADRADVLAEGPVVAQQRGESDPDGVVGGVARDKGDEHRLLVEQAERHARGDEDERGDQHGVADPPQAGPAAGAFLPGKQLEEGSRPARVPAPPAPEEGRARNLGDEVVDRRALEHTEEQVVPEALDLHVLALHKPQVDEHVHADCEHDKATRVLPAAREEDEADPQAGADVGEVEEVERVAQREPQRDGDRLEHRPDHEGGQVVGLLAFTHQRLLAAGTIRPAKCSRRACRGGKGGVGRG